MTTTFLERVEHVLQFLLKLVGPLFVIFATLLIGSIAVVHFVIILPTLISPTHRNDDGTTDKIDDTSTTSHTYLFLYSLFHYSLSFFLLFNVAFNYALTIITSPGHPPRVIIIIITIIIIKVFNFKTNNNNNNIYNLIRNQIIQKRK